MAVAPAAARPRPGGGRLFIIVGLLLAVLAFGAVFLIGGTGGGAALGGPNTTVVIAKQQIPIRHQITSADVETAKISLSGNATTDKLYTNTTDVVALISEVNISKGTVLSADMLARDVNLVPTGLAPAYLPLAKGYVAMTIPTGEQQGVAGHISLGDYITVIASSSIAALGGDVKKTATISKTVFTNVRVIGLGPASTGVTSASGGAQAGGGTGGQVSGVASSLTIMLTQCDAEYFVWFLNNMTVRYTLESFKDYLEQPPQAPDPSCPAITAAGGVSGKQVDARFHFSALS